MILMLYSLSSFAPVAFFPPHLARRQVLDNYDDIDDGHNDERPEIGQL